MKPLTDITPADIMEMSGMELAELIDTASYNRQLVENRNTQSPGEAAFIRHVRGVESDAKNALQAINLKSEQSMHRMLVGAAE